MSDYLVILLVLAAVTILVSYVAFTGVLTSRPVAILLPVLTSTLVLFVLFANAEGPLWFPLGVAMVGLVFLMALAFMVSLFLSSRRD